MSSPEDQDRSSWQRKTLRHRAGVPAAVPDRTTRSGAEQADLSFRSGARAHALRSVGWSGAFLLVSRLSSVLAIPLVLHSLGPALYGVWVMGGALIMVQGLFDLGVGAASARFVAVVAAQGSKPAVVVVFRRALVFYLALSAIVAGPLLIWSADLASRLPSIAAPAEARAAVLIRYIAVAFALTNITLVLASLLQGINRVDAAYRGQALGWLVYVPVLAIGIHLGPAVQAVGLAWVCGYVLQVALLAIDARSAVARLPAAAVAPPSFREMLSLGGWWQLSSWADFATFQFPRLAGGFALSASDLVALDVALRASQLVVAPLYAAFPLVLPAAARVWTLQGRRGLTLFLDRWFVPGAIALCLFTITFISVEQPALAAWTGRSLDSFNLLLDTSVLVGVAAHASTGLFSSVLLATGNISPILHYKRNQLLLSILLVPVSLIAGPVATGLALGLALTLPAIAFDREGVLSFYLKVPSRRSPLWRRLLATAAAFSASLFAMAWVLRAALPEWMIAATLLSIWAGGCTVGAFWFWRSWRTQ